MIQLLLSLLAISGIAALLAVLLEIAHSYIADYGERRIVINKEKELTVQGGSPLLSTLMDQGIFLPSACGGKGTCGLCKAMVVEGGGPVLPTETPYLSPAERDRNTRLSCQVKVREDLEIEIPEELFLIKEFKVKVEHVEQLTPTIRSVSFSIVSPDEGITFKPGQYLQLLIPKYKLSRDEEYRAYSIASKADEPHRVELMITKAPRGVVSTYVHDYLKEGDELKVVGPFGEFYLRPSQRDILMIATGSGLAPIRSMLHQLIREDYRGKVTLFFGAKTRSELLYYDELKGLEERLSGFTFMPTLSRAADDGQWDGKKGRVTNLIEELIPEGAELDVYICGSPAMVQSCVDLLLRKGISEERILYDKFE